MANASLKSLPSAAVYTSTATSINITSSISTMTTPTNDAADATSILPSNMALILTSLTSTSHLQRDRALKSFQSELPQTHISHMDAVAKTLISHISADEPWQAIHSSTVALCHYLRHVDNNNQIFISQTQSLIPFLVSHPEARVRESSTLLIEALSLTSPVTTFQTLSPMLQQRAMETFALDVNQRTKEAARIAARDVHDHAAAEAKTRRNLVHETEGWRGLETTLLAQAALAANCGSDRSITDMINMLACAERARPHPNRFVREAGLHLINACATVAIEVDQVAQMCLVSLEEGIQDNWSQVRFAGCVATRTIMLALPNEVRESNLFPTLLPRMCLNRHYVAEGVRNYSHETWKLLFSSGNSGSGKQWLMKLLDNVIHFFESQTKADNHAVREAACQSLGEIAVKLDTEVISSYAGRIARALVDGFKDESWPVRDCACTALSEVVSKFANDVEKDSLDLIKEMFKLFETHLSDNILSVRKNCAKGFVKACCAFEPKHEIMGLYKLVEVVRLHLVALDKKPDNGNDDDGSEKVRGVKDTQFGASTKIAGNNGQSHSNGHDEAHTDQTMFSCGSLAPKLRRGGGCSDHGFVRPREQWEIAEGGILLWGALCAQRDKVAFQVCEELFASITTAGVKVGEKEFRGKTKLLVSFMECVVMCIDNGMRIENDEMLKGLVTVSSVARDEWRHAGVKEALGEYRRTVMRDVGMKRFMDTEKNVVS